MDIGYTYFHLHGRMARLPFVGALLGLTAAFGLLTMIGMAQVWLHRGSAWATVVTVILLAAGAVNAWAVLALYAKRLHDFSLSGWVGVGILACAVLGFVLVPSMPTLARFLTFVAALAIIGLVLIPGDQGSNDYGPEPGSDGVLHPAE